MITKRLRILALTLFGGTVVLDVGVLEMRYLVPASVQASDNNFIGNPVSYGNLLLRLAQARGKPCDIIFIGASNVEFWNAEGSPVWDKYYAPRHAFNFGAAGDRTEDVLWRFDNMNLQGLKPKAAVIFIGLNNFVDTPGDIALGIQAVMKRAQTAFPGVKVLLVSLTPNDRDDKRVVDANKILQTYADNKNVFYIDIYSKMPKDGDNWKGLKPDHLHMTVEGYQMWAEAMEPVLQKILAEPAAPSQPAPL